MENTSLVWEGRGVGKNKEGVYQKLENGALGRAEARLKKVLKCGRGAGEMREV